MAKGKGAGRIKDTTVWSKNANLVTRVIGDETVLLPIYKTSDEIDCIYTLNKVASRVWEMLDGKKTVGQIKKQVLGEFDTTPGEVDKEMRRLLKDLREIEVIVSRDRKVKGGEINA